MRSEIHIYLVQNRNEDFECNGLKNGESNEWRNGLGNEVSNHWRIGLENEVLNHWRNGLENEVSIIDAMD